MTTTKYRRDFYDTSHLPLKTRFNQDLLQDKESAGDGFGGLQQMLHHLISAYGPRFLIEGLIPVLSFGNITVSPGYAMVDGKVLRLASESFKTVATGQYVYLKVSDSGARTGELAVGTYTSIGSCDGFPIAWNNGGAMVDLRSYATFLSINLLADIAVRGALTINGSSSISGNATVGGALTVSGALSSNTISTTTLAAATINATTVNGTNGIFTGTISGNGISASTATIGATTVTSLNVNGVSTINASGAIAGASLSVSGSISGSSLNLGSGAATIGSLVAGTLSTTSTISSGAKATLESLEVTNATTFKGAVSFNSSATFASSVVGATLTTCKLGSTLDCQSNNITGVNQLSAGSVKANTFYVSSGYVMTFQV